MGFRSEKERKDLQKVAKANPRGFVITGRGGGGGGPRISSGSGGRTIRTVTSQQKGIGSGQSKFLPSQGTRITSIPTRTTAIASVRKRSIAESKLKKQEKFCKFVITKAGKRKRVCRGTKKGVTKKAKQKIQRPRSATNLFNLKVF
jgi:hypothetical protein